MYIGLAPAGPGTASAFDWAPMIDAIGRPQFERGALALLNGLLAVGSWCVYRIWRDRPPVLHLSASHGVADATGSCFSIYRDAGLYRRDTSFDAARQDGIGGQAVLLRMHADDAPSRDHRDAIYLRHGLLERLSIARLDADGSLLAVNLYHHAHQGRFACGEVERFAQVAAALLACVARHLAWGEQRRSPAAATRSVLKQRCPALTERELDVLERLLAGLTYDGIAADMRLSVSTVKTYRARAFDRLGIHFKNELFASFVPSGCRLFG